MPDPILPRPNMYVMLDLASDISADRLRYVYEQHVADAARSQDHRRLLRLSQAFDALPRSVRHAMYPKASTGPASSSGGLVAPPRPTPAAAAARTRRIGRRRRSAS